MLRILRRSRQRNTIGKISAGTNRNGVLLKYKFIIMGKMIKLVLQKDIMGGTITMQNCSAFS